MIWNAILKLVWFLFIQGPLALINAFSKVLEYLTGGIITDILFESSEGLQWDKIPTQFFWFAVVAICLFALIFTIQMIILLFKEATETKAKFVLAIQNGVKAFGFMFLIPMFFFLANFIVQSIANTVINNFGSGSNIAQYLYSIGDPTWDGSPVDSNGFGAPSNIGDYNMIVQIFGTWFMLFAILIIGLIIVQKVIELFFLFIISPIIMIVMVVDDGKAVLTWKDMVIAKFLASTATLIGYYIFISVTQKLLNSDLGSLQDVDWAKPLFIILFLCGGGLATMAFSDIVASFLGESVGIREGAASFKSTLAGGMMAMGAAKMTGRALKFMKGSAGVGNLLGGSDGSGDSAVSSSGGIVSTAFRRAAYSAGGRKGIIGLTGAGIVAGLTAVGAGIGHVTAGAAKTWKSGNRKGFWRKVGGVGLVVGKGITSPIVHPIKSMSRTVNNAISVVTQNKKQRHQDSLLMKRDHYSDKALKIKNEMKKGDYSEKTMNKQLKKVSKNESKANKFQRIHDSNGYKEENRTKISSD